jgi:hypothetical protein
LLASHLNIAAQLQTALTAFFDHRTAMLLLLHDGRFYPLLKSSLVLSAGARAEPRVAEADYSRGAGGPIDYRRQKVGLRTGDVEWPGPTGVSWRALSGGIIGPNCT